MYSGEMLENKIEGGWRTIVGFDEEVLFNRGEHSNYYSSFLHNHPGRIGNWQVKSNTLQIILYNKTNLYQYIKFNRQRMILSNNSGAMEKYERIY